VKKSSVLTTNDVAKHLGVSTQTVINWSKRGIIECFKTPGGHRRFYRQVVLDFQNQNLYLVEKLTDDERQESHYGVIILSSDMDYGNLIKDFMIEKFTLPKGSIKIKYSIVNSSFKAALEIGSTFRSVLIFDSTFLNQSFIKEVENLKDKYSYGLSCIVVLCELSEYDDLSQRSVADIVHSKTNRVTSLMSKLNEYLEQL
jgi:excisionase family DNA binding protein